MTEFYVYAAGDRVLGEVENIAPGHSRQIVISMNDPGAYQVSCRPGMTGSGIRQPFPVTGEALPTAVGGPLVAEQLSADVHELAAGVKAPKFSVDAVQIAGGAQTLLDEIARTKIDALSVVVSQVQLVIAQA